MKKIISGIFGVLVLAVATPQVSAQFQNATDYFNIPFNSVSFFTGIHYDVIFNDSRVENHLLNVGVKLENVDVDFVRSTETYTTINLFKAKEWSSFGWLKAEKAVVVVRHELDYVAWKRFLALLNKKQKLEAQKLKPTRVLPPENLEGI